MSSRIHVFAVAVEVYQDPAFSAHSFAENDCCKFVDAWLDLGVDPITCVKLLGSNATKTIIETSIKNFIKDIDIRDTVVFFVSGQMVSFNQLNFLISHDTQPSDIHGTSVALDTILKVIGERNKGQTMIFIDPSRYIPQIEPGANSEASIFSMKELRHFCESNENQAVFISCKDNESSWSNRTLRQGIWSHCLINALSGNATEAVAKDKLLTDDSLGAYLSEEVPRLLRLTRTGTETQTPVWFGNPIKPILVADLTSIDSKTGANTLGLGSALKDTSLRGEKLGLVRSLSGFHKGHHVPDGHFSSAEAFVKRAGYEEVKNQAEAIYQKIRAHLGYRRKNVNFACDQDAATIKTPDFDVNLSISQDSEDAAGYIITTEIGVIRRQEVFLEDAFSEAFSNYCDTVVIEFSGKINIEEKIDAIEDIPELESHLKYEADLSSLTLDFPRPSLRIHMSDNCMTLSMPESGSLKVLLTNIQSALSTIKDSGIQLLSPV